MPSLCEIAADRVRFPHDQVAVLDGGNQAVGIEREIFGIAIAAEGATDVDPLERQIELGAAPQHLLHIRRARASPDLQHGPFSLSEPAIIMEPQSGRERNHRSASLFY